MTSVWTLSSMTVKEIVYPKMKILSVVHPYVVKNLYDFYSSAEHEKRLVEALDASIFTHFKLILVAPWTDPKSTRQQTLKQAKSAICQ